MSDFTCGIFEDFSRDNFCLLYDGNIVDEVTDKIIDLSENYLSGEKDFEKSKKKISFLLAECFQNIIRHQVKAQPEKSLEPDKGFFLLRNIQGLLLITSGNLIKNQEIANLKASLDKVNSMDPENLKEMYLTILAGGVISAKGGAGLGLIEIARKSGQKIEFVFEDFNHSYAIFYSQVMLKPQGYTFESKVPGVDYLHQAINYHKILLREHILIMQKGDFSKGSVLPVMEIVKKNLENLFNQAFDKKEAYHILVELLQNLGKYALEENNRREGIFLIRKENNHLVITTGNYIKNEDIHPLSSQLDMLNKMGKTELKEKYLKALNEEEKELRLELIEIARRSSGPVYYEFKETFDHRIFVIISVKV